jgi:hypothetical protein
MLSSSVESSAFHLSQEDSTTNVRNLKISEEDSSGTEYGGSSVKYLLYEDERDFKVRFMIV